MTEITNERIKELELAVEKLEKESTRLSRLCMLADEDLATAIHNLIGLDEKTRLSISHLDNKLYRVEFTRENGSVQFYNDGKVTVSIRSFSGYLHSEHDSNALDEFAKDVTSLKVLTYLEFNQLNELFNENKESLVTLDTQLEELMDTLASTQRELRQEKEKIVSSLLKDDSKYYAIPAFSGMRNSVQYCEIEKVTPKRVYFKKVGEVNNGNFERASIFADFYRDKEEVLNWVTKGRHFFADKDSVSFPQE